MHIVGGGSFPAAIGALNVTWPLAVLWYDADGIGVDLRWRPMKHVLRWIMRGYIREKTVEDAWWSATWNGVSAARSARRSIVLVNSRMESCKFIALSYEELERLRLVLGQHNILVERVRSNYFYFGG